MLTWHYITSTEYNNATDAEKSSDKLFFLSDTKEIYRGTQPFTEAVILYATEPTTKAVGKLYINSTTLEGKIWNGSAWTTVINPVQSTLSTTDSTNPVSGAAVANFVATELAKVTGSGDLVASVGYTADTNSLTISMADGSSDTIPMTNVAADLTYNKTTGELKVVNASGTAIGTGINLDLERFISEASYDSDTKKITLTFNDSTEPLEIDVSDLVDTYTAGNTSTVNMTVTGNKFAAEVIVASGTTYAGNLLQSTESGLYVAPVDLSGKIDKVASATAGDVATLTSDGSVADSGVVVGGATFSATPNATTLATEAGVSAITTALQDSIDGKMAKVGTGHTGEIIVAAADGDSSASGVVIGGATLAATPTSGTVATEAAVDTYVKGYAVAKTDVVAAADMSTTVAAASDTKVTSEKAVVDALTWKTTV